MSELVEEITELTKQMYGDNWPQCLRHLADKVSHGRTLDVNELTEAQLERLVHGAKGILRKIT